MVQRDDCFADGITALSLDVLVIIAALAGQRNIIEARCAAFAA
jgi:hypothetical protein